MLNFVNQLNTHGANSVWEHVLLDPSSPKNLKRKPNAKDSLHPTKADFIRAKHLNLAYVLKPTIQNNEDPASVEAELSKQLHASVRTSNLETSLRLLVQGADPNYVHEVNLTLRHCIFRLFKFSFPDFRKKAQRHPFIKRQNSVKHLK